MFDIENKSDHFSVIPIDDRFILVGIAKKLKCCHHSN